MEVNKRLIVGISGASGSIYGVRIMEVLQSIADVESHLIVSKGAEVTLSLETHYDVDYVRGLADVVHDSGNVGASIASGSFKTMGMIIAPCSIKTLSAVANSFNSDLLSRAADVCLKERRRLVLMVRETPFHIGHLDAMRRAAQNGAILAPPIPSFYKKPQSIDDLINHSVGRVLDFFDIAVPEMFERWNEDDGERAARMLR